MKQWKFVIGILNDSYELFLKNFRLLVILGGAQVALGLVKEQSLAEMHSRLWSIPIYLVSIYLDMRLRLALILAFSDCISGQSDTPMGYFQKSSEKIWVFIGVTLLVGLISFAPPAILFSWFLLGEYPIVLPVINFPIAVIAAIIASFFCLAPYLVALNPHSRKALNESNRLLSEFRFEALLILLAALVLSWGPDLIVYSLLHLSRPPGEIITLAASVFTTPILAGAMVLFYHKVTDREKPSVN